MFDALHRGSYLLDEQCILSRARSGVKLGNYDGGKPDPTRGQSVVESRPGLRITDYLNQDARIGDFGAGHP